jgi:hypothetical protein
MTNQELQNKIDEVTAEIQDLKNCTDTFISDREIQKMVKVEERYLATLREQLKVMSA